MDVDLEHLDGYSAEDLERALQDLDQRKQDIRARMRVISQALSERHAAEVVRARVANMGDEERRHLTMALQGIETAEAVGDPPAAVQTVSAGDVASLHDVLGGG